MLKNFDLTGWTCFSDRRNSKSYVSADHKWMVKFDTEATKRNEQELEKEKEVSLKAIDIGVITPHVRDVVALPDGTLGLIYEYIEGKKSIARAAGEDLEHIDDYMLRFARAAKDLHSHICDPKKFDSFEDRVRRQLDKASYLNDEQKKKALVLVDGIEKKYTCLHGDFHTGNFIMAGEKEFAIDLGSISYGNEIYDIAVFYYFTNLMPEFITKKLLHCENKYARLMWISFAKHYYGISEDKVKEMDKDMIKYALACFAGMQEMCQAGPEVIDNVNKYFDEAFK